jgi:hypothetical protein
MKLDALLITITLALTAEAVPVTAQTSLPSMVPLQVSKEGNPADLAGVEEVDAGFPDSRIWGGGGRRRNAWEPNSKMRNFNEEAKDLLTGAVAYEVDVSSGNSQDHRLFTLTSKQILRNDSGAVATIIPARLRVDNIANQTAPIPHQPDIVFADDESPGFLRVSPDDKLLLVGVQVPSPPSPAPKYHGEIRVFDYTTGTLVEVSSTPLPAYDSMNPNLTGCGHYFTLPKDAQIARIQTVETAPGSGVWLEERMALVTANVASPTGDPPPCDDSALVKQTRGLLVLNLQNPAQPYWLDTDLSTQAWDPCRTPGDKCDDWFTAGFCHVRAQSFNPAHASHQLRDYVYMTGGVEVGIRRIDLTDVIDPLVGIPQDDMFELSIAPGGAVDGLFAVRTDPQDQDLLYVYGRQRAYVVDRPTLDPFHPSGVVSYVRSPQSSDLTFGNDGDAHLVLVDPGAGLVERESWTLADSSADYVLRITNFLQDGMGGLDAPDTQHGEFFSAGPTDGAVADFLHSLAYALTFGGVARWDITAGNELLPAPGSYQPAKVGGMSHTTESLELADLADLAIPPNPPDQELIANTADGGFVSWKIDLNPMSASYLDPLAASYWEPPSGFWPTDDTMPSEPGYGNDIAVWNNEGVKWVILDYSSTADQEFGFGGMRWNDGFWPPQAIRWKDDGSDTPSGWSAIIPKVRDIYIHRNCLVAGANGGFLTSRLPMNKVTDHVYTNDIGGLGFNRVLGVALYTDPDDDYPDRLFVSLGDTGLPPSGQPNNRFAFAMYGFDAQTGTVVDASGNPTESPLQVLFDGQSAKPDDFPGVYVGGGEQVSLVRISANPLKLRLFSGSGNGVTLDIEYNGSTDLMTPRSFWHNGGYTGPVGKTTPYLLPKAGGGSAGFGPGLGGPVVDYELRLVVTKHQETFEIVNPPDMQ